MQHIAEKHPHGLSYFDKSWGRLTAAGDNLYGARRSSQRPLSPELLETPSICIREEGDLKNDLYSGQVGEIT